MQTKPKTIHTEALRFVQHQIDTNGWTVSSIHRASNVSRRTIQRFIDGEPVGFWYVSAIVEALGGDTRIVSIDD